MSLATMIFKCKVCGSLTDEGDPKAQICLRCIDDNDPKIQEQIQKIKTESEGTE